MSLTTAWFSVWQQSDGTYRYRLAKKGPCHPRMTGVFETEEECIHQARNKVRLQHAIENAERNKRCLPTIHGKKKKYEPIKDSANMLLFN